MIRLGGEKNTVLRSLENQPFLAWRPNCDLRMQEGCSTSSLKTRILTAVACVGWLAFHGLPNVISDKATSRPIGHRLARSVGARQPPRQARLRHHHVRLGPVRGRTPPSFPSPSWFLQLCKRHLSLADQHKKTRRFLAGSSELVRIQLDIGSRVMDHGKSPSYLRYHVRFKLW